MGPFDQLFILSPRGDSLIYKDYRGGQQGKDLPLIFFSYVMEKDITSLSPLLYLDGLNYVFLHANGLYFVITAKQNISGMYALEFLSTLTSLLKDYCGVLGEEGIRRNFVLIYELLDEAVDFGFSQNTRTDELRGFIHNPASDVDDLGIATRLGTLGNKIMNRKTMDTEATSRPLEVQLEQENRSKNELFVDLLERVTVLIDKEGEIIRSEVDGALVMKSYLHGTPRIDMALNREFIFDDSGANSSTLPGTTVVNDMNFHSSITATQVEDFLSSRALSFLPPAGEFTVLSYRVSSGVKIPFRIFPFVEVRDDPMYVEVVVKIRCDLQADLVANNVEVTIPVPRTTATAHISLDGSQGPDIGQLEEGQKAVFDLKESQISWNIKRFLGLKEHSLRARLTLSQPREAHTIRQVRHVSMDFEIPMYNCSNVHIAYLRVVERSEGYDPYKWIRYVTQPRSYCCYVH